MKTSENGIAFIKENEGLVLTIKSDNGKPVIGYGHDLTPEEIASGKYANGITPDQAGLLILIDLASKFEPAVNHLAPWANQNQFDSLSDFAYNLGDGDLATMLHHGESQVPTQILAWCYERDPVTKLMVQSPGLLARRQKEVVLFNS